MDVATSTVETATMSIAAVPEATAWSVPTAGTVSAGGAITGGRSPGDSPLGDGDGVDRCGVGVVPVGCGAVAVAGRDPECEVGGDVARLAGAVGTGAGLGDVGGPDLLQQWPVPWWSAANEPRQWP
jgi:hypothetical protein